MVDGEFSLNTIKEFLGYCDEFWNYVSDKITYVDSRDKGAIYFYGVYLKYDKDNNIIGMNICVPEIINLFTASVNVHEFKHAWDAYLLLGNKLSKSNEFYEKSAKKKELEFKNRYKS